MLCILRPLCVNLGLGPEQHRLPNTWRGLGSKLRVPPVGPPYGPLPMRTKPFLRWVGCSVAPENHLAEVVGSKPGRPAHRGKRHITPFLGLLADLISRG